jgi:NADH-quinone oxidoreductase subunit L
MTAFYAWRLMFMTFHGTSRATAHDAPHESPVVMLLPLFLLAIGAIFGGIGERVFIGTGATEFWGKALVLAADERGGEAQAMPAWVTMAATLAMASGFGLSFLYYVAVPSLPALTARLFKPIYVFLLNKWYFDELYDALLVRPTLRLGRFLWKVGDGVIIDGLGPDGIAARVLWATGRIVRLQTGYVYHYAFAMLIGVALIITCFMFYDVSAYDIGALFGRAGR